MNAEQLNGLLARLHDSHTAAKTVEKLNDVREALEHVAGNPTDGNLQTQFRARLQVLFDAMTTSPLNHFTVRETKLIADLDLEVLVGQRIIDEAQAAMRGQDITPRIAQEAINQLHARVSSTLKKIQRVSQGLSELGIEMGDPDQGEVELGVYLPRAAENMTLEDVLKEGEDLNRLVSLAYEIVEGTPHSPEVAYLTSSDYGILVKVAPKVLRFLVWLIERALGIRKQWMENEQLYRQLRETGHDEETVKAMEETQREKRDAEVEQFIRISIEETSTADGGRRNELSVQMSKGIQLLLQKHEHGNYCDIRIGMEEDAPAPEDGVAEPAELLELRERVKLLREINSLSQSMHLLEQNKAPPVASLPAPESKE